MVISNVSLKCSLCELIFVSHILVLISGALSTSPALHHQSSSIHVSDGFLQLERINLVTDICTECPSLTMRLTATRVNQFCILLLLNNITVATQILSYHQLENPTSRF